MIRALTNALMREADAHTIGGLGVSSEALMARAGAAIAEETEKIAAENGAYSVLVVCGTGNNGGDGYVAAEILRKKFDVKVYAVGGNLSDDCRREKSRYGGCFVASLQRCDIVLDCIFGTGLSRGITGEISEIIEKINSMGSIIVSADIPSGLSGDGGQILGCAVHADYTVAVAEYKTGMFLGDGLDCCGKIIKKDIGIVCPREDYCRIYEDEDVSVFFPVRKRNTHKGSYGRALLAAGCAKYPGAAALSLQAALKSGCGYTSLCTDEKIRYQIAARYPQAIYCGDIDMRSDCIAVGMGCGVTNELYGQIKELLHGYNGVLLIDADGLNTLAKFGADVLRNASCRVIITPHVKEFSRLTGMGINEIIKNPVEVCSEYAKSIGAVVVLKGAGTVISDGSRTAINVRGSTALAKGGSGDMLSGFICGTAARGIPPFEAAVAGCYVLGMSAEISSAQKTDYCATAKDIINNLHFSVMRLTQKK